MIKKVKMAGAKVKKAIAVKRATKGGAAAGARAGVAGGVKKAAKKSPAKMAKKSPMKKPLIGKQANLPKSLRDKILASPAKMLKPAALRMMKKK